MGHYTTPIAYPLPKRSFWQEGLENNTEKGIRTARIFRDRESIQWYLFFGNETA